ncbi:hypothetical protein Ahy_B03g062481 isoform C [Arachis hypogaea]|uniref:Uncharacterized protein n=1 Tax=Arachis hypogaea TaxID=3818 RepID=A0A444ZUJ9_ARAHY|nr:hypothetical protein Ahy_B03g062481 isoform C [Arachis hypogaea]
MEPRSVQMGKKCSSSSFYEVVSERSEFSCWIMPTLSSKIRLDCCIIIYIATHVFHELFLIRTFLCKFRSNSIRYIQCLWKRILTNAKNLNQESICQGSSSKDIEYCWI